MDNTTHSSSFKKRNLFISILVIILIIILAFCIRSEGFRKRGTNIKLGLTGEDSQRSSVIITNDKENMVVNLNGILNSDGMVSVQVTDSQDKIIYKEIYNKVSSQSVSITLKNGIENYLVELKREGPGKTSQLKLHSDVYVIVTSNE